MEWQQHWKKRKCMGLTQRNGQKVADNHSGDVVLVTPDREREAARDHVLAFGVRVLEQAGCQHGLLPSIECNVSIFLYVNPRERQKDL